MSGSQSRKSYIPGLVSFGVSIVIIIMGVASLLFTAWDRMEILRSDLLEAQLELGTVRDDQELLAAIRSLRSVLEDNSILRRIGTYQPFAHLAARTLYNLLDRPVALVLDSQEILPASTILFEEIERAGTGLRDTIEEMVIIVALLVLLFVMLTLSLTSRLELEQRRRVWDRRLTHTLINREEAIRKHLAQELHDDVAQTLALARISTSSESHKLIGAAIQKIRALTRDLTLPKVSATRLNQALNNLVESYRQHSDFRLDFAVTGSLYSMENEEINTHLYRIIQELLQNAFKHSKAQQVSLKIVKTDKLLHLQYSDDGVGLPLKSSPDPRHSGLRNIQDRADLMEAILELDSQPGQGVRLNLRLELVQRSVL